MSAFYFVDRLPHYFEPVCQPTTPEIISWHPSVQLGTSESSPRPTRHAQVCPVAGVNGWFAYATITMEDIEELRRLLREEQRRREEAEDTAEASRPQTLQQYLEACHSLNLAIQVVTDRSLTTQGDTTNPTGRIFPRRIIPWDDFAARQEEIWDDLSIGDLFSSLPTFLSQHQLKYLKSLFKSISSELGLQDFEREVVETRFRSWLIGHTWIRCCEVVSGSRGP